MKKILIILITIPLIFGSCEKEDDSPNTNSNNSNNPIGNIPNGVVGYYYNGYINKTTDSGVTWTQLGDYIGGINQINFVN